MGKIFYDITLVMDPDMLIYPGDPEFSTFENSSISRGDRCNLSVMTLGSHTGTHMDAPKHFFDDGCCVDQLPLNHFIGRARVFEITGRSSVDVCDLAKLNIAKGDIVLLKTENSMLLHEKSFSTGYTYITPDAAKYLVEAGVRTLGFDYLTVEKYKSGKPEVHYTLLGGNVVIMEGLDLSKVVPGEYDLVALPLKIKGGNGSPVRAVLSREE